LLLLIGCLKSEVLLEAQQAEVLAVEESVELMFRARIHDPSGSRLNQAFFNYECSILNMESQTLNWIFALSRRGLRYRKVVSWKLSGLVTFTQQRTRQGREDGGI
jgi:hypothetical protein